MKAIIKIPILILIGFIGVVKTHQRQKVLFDSKIPIKLKHYKQYKMEVQQKKAKSISKGNEKKRIQEIQKKNKQIPDYRISFEQKDKWKKYLVDNGFVVIANWINEKECDEYVQKSWDMMEKLSQGKLDRNDKASQILGANYPFVMHGGMIQYIGHSQMQWDLRKQCKPIFQEIWGTKKLKSSFDGLCFMNGVRRYKPRADTAFLHCDQAPNKNYLWSYQGVMTLTAADQNGGGFVCVPKTNHYHHKYFEGKNMLKETANWHIVPDKDKNKEPFINYQKINNQAGDFILFDSRTFHCNTVPQTETLRVCTYICMIPESKVPQKVQEKRKKAFEQKRCTCHHPGDGFKSFPILPRFVKDHKEFIKLVRQVNQSVLDEDMKKMI